MNSTKFYIKRMDCSSEEQLIRMRLEYLSCVKDMIFDLEKQELVVFHDGTNDQIVKTLELLNFGSRQVEFKQSVDLPNKASEQGNKSLLFWALVINFVLFVGEMTVGLISGSMGLIADSLDMLADSFVYALSLLAVGRTMARKRRLAASSGYVQFILAILGLVEVVRRFVVPMEMPSVQAMIIMSLLALSANLATLILLSRTKRGEVHIEASWIFTSNDIKVNLLVIIAALFVYWTSSQIPDLVVGGLIFLIVANGSRSILALSRASEQNV